MPRDSNGNYTLPTGNPVVTGTTISSSWANTTLNDVANVLTASLDRSGNGGMLAPFKSQDGTVSAPGLTFANEPTTGLYRIGVKHIGFSMFGSEIFDFTQTGFNFDGLNIIATAPTSGVAFTITGNSSSAAVAITGGASATALTIAAGASAAALVATGLISTTASFQVTGSGSTGIVATTGTEIYNTGTVGAIQAYNRGTSAYMPMYVIGSTVALEISGTAAFSINAAGQATLATPTSNSASALTINSYGSGGSSGLTITGQSPTNNYPDLYIVRASSTANTQGYGSSIQFGDFAGGCFGMVQFSGQQIEFWQFPTSGAWGQSAFFDSSRNLNINNGSGRSPVYAGVPQAGGASSNYTLVLGDANKFWLQNSGTAHTVTIPANASVAFPIGTVITFIGIAGSANTTISPSSGVTLLFVPTGTTGNRTLSGNGMATAIKVSTDYWVISGSGLT